MKQLNVTYEDKEFVIIEKAKELSKVNWHDAILEWAKLKLEEKKK